MLVPPVDIFGEYLQPFVVCLLFFFVILYRLAAIARADTLDTFRYVQLGPLEVPEVWF